MTRLFGGISCLLLFLAAVTAHAMTVYDIVDLLEAGVGEAVILDQIEAEDASFRLSTEDLITLKRAGASDELLQAMIALDGEKPEAPSRDWTRAYHQPSYIRVNLYYDPFGYHWYGWPYYFAYYYPFRWSDCGFYHAGWWSRSWCGWGPAARWYWDRYHWHSRPVRTDGRHAWNREPAGRYVPGSGATGSQGRIVRGRDAVTSRPIRERIDRPTRAVSGDRGSAPTGVERPRTPRRSEVRPARPAPAPRSRPATPGRVTRPDAPRTRSPEPVRSEPARPSRTEPARPGR